MPKQDQVIQSSFVRRDIPGGGPISSRDLNASFNEIKSDLLRITEGLNRFQSISAGILSKTFRELRGIEGRSKKESDREQQNLFQSLARTYELQSDINNPTGVPTIWAKTVPGGRFVASFSGDLDLRYIVENGAGISDVIQPNRRLRWDKTFGELTLPINHIVNRFFHAGSVGEQSVIPRLTPQVSPSGFNAYPGGRTTDTDPANALNGQNFDMWIRRVEFPLSSPVTEVIATFVTSVPATFGSAANSISISPFPSGQLDLLDIQYSSTISAPSKAVFNNKFDEQTGLFRPIPNNDPVALVPDIEGPLLGIGNKRFLFKSVASLLGLKVILRQRNWVEEDGKKVFYIGMQELAAQIIEWDNAPFNSSFGLGNQAIVRFRTPVVPWNSNNTRPNITSLTSFISDVGFNQNNGVNTGLRFLIYESVPNNNLGTLRYQTDTAPLLFSSPPSTVISGLNSDELFIRIDMCLADTGISPVLRNFSLDYLTSEVV